MVKGGNGSDSVNIYMVKSHSTRAASTSAARAMYVPLDDILVAAGWTNEITVHRFYNKPITGLGVFARTILSSVP